MTGKRSGIWLLVCALCAMAAYMSAGEEGPIYILAFPATLIAWWLTGGSPTRPLPRGVINLLLIVVVGSAVLVALRAGFNVELFCRFVTMLLIAKIMDRRNARDAAQVYMLSVFLGIGAVLTSNGLVMAAVLVLLLIAVTMGIMVFRVAVAEERRDAVAERLGRGVQPAADARAMGGLRRMALASVVVTLCISAAVFVVMPRGMGSSAFGAWGNPGLGRTVAFNDEIDLGTAGLISESQEPVLDMRVIDRDGNPLGRDGRRFYLRGAVLDEYDDGNWTTRDRSGQSVRRVSVMNGTRSMTLTSAARPRDWTIEQQITIRRLPRPDANLFAVWEPLRVMSDEPTRFSEAADHQVFFGGTQRGRFDYRVQSIDREGDAGEPRFEWEPFVPFESEVVRSYTVELLDRIGIEPLEDGSGYADEDRRSIAANISNHFNAGGFSYTLDAVAPPPGRDAVEWFLTDGRSGHCEYFATGMAAMCRSVGVNARVITGYVATEFNETTGYYLVRASNAHAWVEVEVVPGRWATFDPTPARDFARIHEPPPTWATAFRRLFETIEFAWIRAVVSFDEDQRRGLIGSGFLDGERSGTALADAFDRIRAGGTFLMIRALSVGLVVFAGVLIAGLATLQIAPLAVPALRRGIGGVLDRIAAMLSGGGTIARVDSARADVLRMLERLGVPKPAWVPLRRHVASARVIGAIPPDGRPAVDRVVGLLYAWQFGARSPDLEEMERLRRVCRSMRPMKDA